MEKDSEGVFLKTNTEAIVEKDYEIVRASHILVKTEEEAARLKAKIDEGADFAELALKNSNCPSRDKGGDLGEFGRWPPSPPSGLVCYMHIVSAPTYIQAGAKWWLSSSKYAFTSHLMLSTVQ